MGAESRDPPPPASPSSDPAGDAASPAAFSIDFGSPSALEQIRSLTDVGAMTRLLHECIAYQRSLDLNLSSLLSQRPDLDRHLSSLLRSTHLLDLARHDSSLLLSSVQNTSSLADKVSRKVRQLDLAQSRVSDTLSRIDAIIHRSHSLDKARRALDADDFPACAEAVRSFLQIDSQFDLDPGSEHSQLVEIKTRLETLTRSRLSTAIANRDHPAVLRYIRIFPPLGIPDEGLQLYVSYLRKVISLRSRLEFEHLSDLAAAAAQPDFIGCLTGLFKDIVLAVEENDEVLRGLSGEDGIVYAICELQEECETRGTQILKKYMDYRRLARLASEVNSRGSNLLSGAPQGPEPREVEIFLEEILSLTQLGEDYTEFMVSKIRSLGSLKDDLAPRAMTTFRSGNFSKVVQDLTGFYVVFEEFFMVENVMKALSIDEHVPDSLTTSMVEDVFFVLQSCSRRAVSTANSSSVLAVISRAMNLLSSEYQDTLERKIRESNSGVRLFVGGVGVQKTGEEIAVALNNVDVSGEYVLKLRREIEEQCLEMFTAPADREKVKSCLSELTEINSRFKKLLNDGMDQLVMMVTPRIRPVLDSVATVSYELSDAEYEGNEENDPWVRKLLHTVESNMVWLQPVMTSNNYDAFIHQVIDFVVKRLEVIMMQKRFNQLGGLQLDREVRSLVNHFSERSQRPVRDKFARLSQMSTILNFERVSEILDFWGENAGHMTWLLTPSEVRRVLGLRLDFKPEAIAALRL